MVMREILVAASQMFIYSSRRYQQSQKALQGKASITKLLFQQQAQRVRNCVIGTADHYRATQTLS
jgi:P2-related tail formation protein